MQPEHEEEFKVHEQIGPFAMLTWCLAVLIDVVEADMVGKERDEHIEDSREGIIKAMERFKST